MALALTVFGPVATAQDWPAASAKYQLAAPARPPLGLDERLLSLVNSSEAGPVRWILGSADRSAYPVLYGALPTAWLASALRGQDHEPALQLTASMMGGYASAVLLKRLVGRPRPPTVLPWVITRPHYPGGRNLDPYSWPSGHATLAAALATTMALHHPGTAVPLGVWAGLVGMSRVWLGVHYPSDVVAGWALGAGSAWIVYSLRNSGRSESLDAYLPPITLSVPFR